MPLSALKNIRPSTRAVGFASEVGWLDKTLPQPNLTTVLCCGKMSLAGQYTGFSQQ
jgi:hypothetical protein